MSNIINNLNDSSFDQHVEAKRIGYKFMKVYLHHSKIGQGQHQVIISGAIELKGYKAGLNNMGQQAYDFKEIRGGSMVFRLDPAEREFICYLYDDPGRGYFSKAGYNRDLLASNFGDDFFVIKDPTLYADIQIRAEKGKELEFKKLDHGFKSVASNASRIEVESEIEALKQRLKMIEDEEKKMEADDNKRQAAVDDARKKQKDAEEKHKLALIEEGKKLAAEKESKSSKPKKSEEPVTV